MEWGEKEDFLEDVWQKTGVMPAALANKPILEYWMPGYLRAFWILCARRSLGMSPNPISFEAICQYFDRSEFDDFEEFQALIAAMDDKWTAIQASRKSK